MDKQVRISNGSHQALKRFADDKGISIRAAAAIAVSALYVNVVVAVNADGDHDIVEVYAHHGHASRRIEELQESGFLGRNISEAGRRVLSEPELLRKYGPDWKEAVGWTSAVQPGHVDRLGNFVAQGKVPLEIGRTSGSSDSSKGGEA